MTGTTMTDIEPPTTHAPATTPMPMPMPMPMPTAATEPRVETALLTLLDAGVVTEAIQAAGCGVTPVVAPDGVTHLHSACHGVAFQVLWGNPVPPAEEGGAIRWADLTLSCPLRVQGGMLPATLESEWHRAKRFARVSRHADHVVLEMDIVAVGGISKEHLDVQLRLWTQMMGQFFAFLRNLRTESDAAVA
jgi:hypothetical protein